MIFGRWGDEGGVFFSLHVHFISHIYKVNGMEWWIKWYYLFKNNAGRGGSRGGGFKVYEVFVQEMGLLQTKVNLESSMKHKEFYMWVGGRVVYVKYVDWASFTTDKDDDKNLYHIMYI